MLTTSDVANKRNDFFNLQRYYYGVIYLYISLIHYTVFLRIL